MSILCGSLLLFAHRQQAIISAIMVLGEHQHAARMCTHKQKSYNHIPVFFLADAALVAFRDAMVVKSPNWANALASWKCPTPAGNSDAPCDPCGRGAVGNWLHMHCRGNTRGELGREGGSWFS